MTQDQANRIIDTLLARTSADHCTVSIDASTTSNVRFARNMVTTSGETVDHTVNSELCFAGTYPFLITYLNE